MVSRFVSSCIHGTCCNACMQTLTPISQKCDVKNRDVLSRIVGVFFFRVRYERPYAVVLTLLPSCSRLLYGKSRRSSHCADSGDWTQISSRPCCCCCVTALTSRFFLCRSPLARVEQVTAAVYLVGASVYASFYRAEPLDIKDRSVL